MLCYLGPFFFFANERLEIDGKGFLEEEGEDLEHPAWRELIAIASFDGIGASRRSLEPVLAVATLYEALDVGFLLRAVSLARHRRVEKH